MNLQPRFFCIDNPMPACLSDPFTQIHADKLIMGTRLRIQLGQDEQLLAQSNHAIADVLDALRTRANVFRQILRQHQFGLHLQTRQRGAQLMRGISHKSALCRQ